MTASPADLPSIFETPVEPHVRLARRRAWSVLAAFALGILLSRALPSTPIAWWILPPLLLSPLAILARGRAALALLIAASLFLGAAWHAHRILRAPPSPFDAVIRALTHDDPASPAPILTVEAVALDDPEPAAAPDGPLARFAHLAPASRFHVRLVRLLDRDLASPASGVVAVRLDGVAPPPILAGQLLRITGAARVVPPPLNPGQPDPRALAAQSGLVGSLSCASADLVQPLTDPSFVEPTLDVLSRAFLRLRADLRAHARRVMDVALDDARLDGEARALVLALILGERGRDADDLAASFTRLGLLHAITISGFHLAILAAAALHALRLTGDRGFLEPLLVALLILLYTLVIPPQAPALRAAVMVLALLLAEALGRRYDRLTLLAWIALALLLWKPLDLLHLGFQLTFAMTALLYRVVPAFRSFLFGLDIKGTLPPRGLRHFLANHLAVMFSSCLLCALVASPIVLFRTGLFSPVAFLASLLATPLIVLVLLAGYTLFTLTLLAPSLAPTVGWLLALVARSTLALAHALDRLPFASLRLPPVSLAWTIAATLAILAWARRPTLRDARPWLAIALLAAWLSVEWSRPPLARGVALRIDTLAVSDGSCHLLRSGRDALLWDAGTLGSPRLRADVPRALRSLGAWRAPTVVITHPDLDHFGLLPDLLDPLDVRSVLLPQRFLDQARDEPRGPAAALLDLLHARGIDTHAVAAGDALTLGECTLVFLSPPADLDDPLDNEHSLVASITPRDADPSRPAILLTGDIQARAIARLAAEYPRLHPVVLELPHHGSGIDAAARWAAGLAPDLALQSTGPRRLTARDWRDTLPRSRVLVTARDGAAWAEVTRDLALRAGSTRDPR